MTGSRPQPPTVALRIETAVAVFIVAMSTAPLFPLLYAPKHLPYEDIVWMRYLWLPVYTAAACYSVWHFRALLRSAPAVIPTALLLVFAAASAAWSIAPDITVRRAEALGFNGLMAFYLAARFSWRALVEILACAILILALGSYVMCLGLPHIGIHSEANAGAWRGLWPEKNELGFIMVIGAQASVACALLQPERRRLWVVSALLCATLVILSRSGTSLLCMVGSIGAALGLVMARRGPTLAIGVAFLAGCALLALVFTAVLDLPLVLSLLGKEPTLTGRTDVWAAVSHRIAERPMFGYGYAAFWYDMFGPARLVREEAKWEVPSAHNGWLEMLLQIGWIGTVMAAAYCALTVTTLLRRLFTRQDGFWALMYVGAFLALTFSESVIEKPNTIQWILFATISIKLLADVLAPAPARFRSSPAAPKPELVSVRPSSAAPVSRR